MHFEASRRQPLYKGQNTRCTNILLCAVILLHEVVGYDSTNVPCSDYAVTHDWPMMSCTLVASYWIPEGTWVCRYSLI